MEGAASVDLTPVILEIERQTEVLQPLLMEIHAYQAATIGVILGGIVILVLAVMFR